MLRPAAACPTDPPGLLLYVTVPEFGESLLLHVLTTQ